MAFYVSRITKGVPFSSKTFKRGTPLSRTKEIKDGFRVPFIGNRTSGQAIGFSSGTIKVRGKGVKRSIVMRSRDERTGNDFAAKTNELSTAYI